MKIKKNTFVMLGLLYCIIMQCKWFNIIGLNDAIWFHVERILYFLLFLYCRFDRNVYSTMKPYYKKIDLGMIAIFIIGLFEYIYTVVFTGTDNQVVIENSVYAYIKLLAVYPLLYLLVFYSCSIVQYSWNSY